MVIFTNKVYFYTINTERSMPYTKICKYVSHIYIYIYYICTVHTNIYRHKIPKLWGRTNEREQKYTMSTASLTKNREMLLPPQADLYRGKETLNPS